MPDLSFPSGSSIEQLPISWWGALCYRLFPYRYRIVRANVQQVFSDRISDGQKKHLIKAFYSHMLTSIREMIQVRFMREEQLSQLVDVLGHQHVLDVAAQGRGVLILTGHFGSWEVAPMAGILNFKQFQGRFHCIRRTLVNKTIETILFRRYARVGLRVIPNKNALNQVIEALSHNDAVIFVMDQHASLVNRDGIAAEFFGKKAGTYRSLATCSRYTGVPVIPASTHRLPDGRHVLEFHAPIAWKEQENSQASLYYNTCAYNRALEKMVLAHPAQWLWLHRRWKLK